jgi:hypothetical protein
MKQPTRKSSILALVGPADPGHAKLEERAAALKESFDGWLDSVAPNLLQPAADEQPVVSKRSRRSLTYYELLRVNRATIRESTSPRHWPPDVVLSFLAAEVIKRNDSH